nr:MAG TPA: hypothetical protein [Caudoviricetes sp.]
MISRGVSLTPSRSSCSTSSIAISETIFPGPPLFLGKIHRKRRRPRGVVRVGVRLRELRRHDPSVPRDERGLGRPCLENFDRAVDSSLDHVVRQADSVLRCLAYAAAQRIVGGLQAAAGSRERERVPQYERVVLFRQRESRNGERAFGFGLVLDGFAGRIYRRRRTRRRVDVQAVQAYRYRNGLAAGSRELGFLDLPELDVAVFLRYGRFLHVRVRRRERPAVCEDGRRDDAAVRACRLYELFRISLVGRRGDERRSVGEAEPVLLLYEICHCFDSLYLCFLEILRGSGRYNAAQAEIPAHAPSRALPVEVRPGRCREVYPAGLERLGQQVHELVSRRRAVPLLEDVSDGFRVVQQFLSARTCVSPERQDDRAVESCLRQSERLEYRRGDPHDAYALVDFLVPLAVEPVRTPKSDEVQAVQPQRFKLVYDSSFQFVLCHGLAPELITIFS